MGDVSYVLYWSKYWVPRVGPLLSLALSNLSQHDLDLKVVDVVLENGSWDLSYLLTMLTLHVSTKFLSMTPPNINFGLDRIS